MLIRRSAPQRNFTVLPNEFLQDGRVTWATRGLLAEVLSRPDGWTATADSLSDQARKLRPDAGYGEGRRAVRAMFAEAKRFGYIVVEKEHIPAGEAGAGRFRTVLAFYDTPQVAHQGTASGMSVPPAETGKSPVRTDVPLTDVSVSGTSIERTENKEPNGITSCVGVALATPNGSHSDRHGVDADAPTEAAAVSIPKQRQSKASPQQQRQLSNRVSPEDRAKCNRYIALLPRLDDDEIDDALVNLWVSRERFWISAYQEMRKKFGGTPLPKPYYPGDHGYIDPDTPEQARFMYEKALRFMSRDGNWDDSLLYPLEQLAQAVGNPPPWAA